MGIADWDKLTASDDLLLLSKLDTTRAVGATEALPISGVFGWLPPELVEAVCAALLRAVRPNTRWGAERAFLDFGAMVATCRGAKAAISRPLQIELRCRRAPGLSTGSDLLRLQFPYTEIATRRIRARFELAVLGRAIALGAAHCADPTRECCRGERDRINRLRSEVECAPGSLCAVALGGRVQARISVVASSGAQILCATDDGVILRDNARIWAVAPRPSEEFFPGQELATTTLAGAASATSTCTWAAAEGAHVAVCVLNAGDLDVYTVTVWADHGRRVLSVHRVSRLGDGADRADLHRMWMRNGAVWLACVANALQYVQGEWLRLVRLVPGDEAQTWTSTTITTTVRHMSVANQAGHMAYMCGTVPRRTQHVRFFDQDDRHISDIGIVTATAGFDRDVTDMVALLPHGDVVVVMLREHLGPCFVFYRRLWGFGWSKGLNCFMAGAACRATTLKPVHSTVFSPCGETMLIGLRHAVSGAEAGGILAINVARTMRCEQMVSQYTPLGSTQVPRQMVWSDGVWLETADPGGVVRLGLM